MPTGYTATIEDGTTARDFLLTCARAFGACVMQRDAPMNEPPKPQEPDDYYAKAVDRAHTDLDAALSRGDAEWEAAAKAAYEHGVASWEASEAKRAARVALLSRVANEVEAWQPPTPDHAGLKKFALEQIASDLKWESGGYPRPVARPWRTYRDEEIERARREYARAVESLSEELARAAGRNAWIRDLYASLPTEERPR